jgi:hypothetical protein
MKQNRTKLSLVQSTGLAAAILILAGAIATAVQPSSVDQPADRAPDYIAKSAALRHN